MAADSKVINDTVLEVSQLAIAIALAKSVKDQHTQLNQIKDNLEAGKESLCATSKSIFVKDLDKEIPEILGNHEYHTEAGTVTVNFKVTGNAPKQINNRPAAEVVREVFEENTEKLFEISDEIEVTASEAELRAQVCDHPELFQVALKPLTHDQIKTLMIQHPEWLNVIVSDRTQYAAVYGDSIILTPVVGFKNGFIEALGRFNDIAKKRVRGLVKAILPHVVQITVNCGNRSKKK